MEFTNAQLTGMLFVGFFGTVLTMLGLIAWSLKLNHDRRMALIEEGEYDALNDAILGELTIDDWEATHTLGVGLLGTAFGAGRTLEHIITGAPLNGSLIITLLGLSILTYYVVTAKNGAE